ncbi:MAG: glycosyltransferase family 2 protein [Verrucomicrobiae bacterium]|nr:glycosyltransferase family 2 protein [Verrucomicrobiae bacterium]
MTENRTEVELSIVMPCLNEAETLGRCVEKAQRSLAALKLSGEVVVADNGSTDGSQQIAERLGARVVHVAEKGYGSALRGGIEAARGKWIIMGDADDSYDFSDLAAFVERLRAGDELVMGCRMPAGGGRIMPGAMPWKHRWIGNPALSFIGRLFFRCPAHDFHCGLRAFTKDAFARMDLHTTGMEFASEMVIKATMRGLRISEVPITLYKDGRSRPPHLRSWRDGWRHLRFMLLFSPRWLFLIPSLALMAVGLCGMAVLSLTDVHVGRIHLEAGTLAVASMATLVGFQLFTFACLAKAVAISKGLLSDNPLFNRFRRFFSLEKGVLLGVVLVLAGVALLARAVFFWGEVGFGSLAYADNLRRIIPAATLTTFGIQVAFSSFFMGVLDLKTSR